MRLRHIAIASLFLVLEQGVTADLVTDAISKYLGAPACGSTSCHGGADEKKNQNLIWSKLDYHSRSYATLTSARSERFADVLKLGDATRNPRCTVCHAPLEMLEAKDRLTAAKPVHGVSCESCHAPAENWIRSHTRPDFSHGDRVAAGMRDLKSLYVRANTCVACHQTLDPELAAAGHPELIFELDGQSVTEPKHWRDLDENAGAKSWLIGQTVALREMSWQLSQLPKADENLATRWNAVVWLLRPLADLDPMFAEFKSLPLGNTKGDFEKAQKISDDVAKRVDEMNWSADLTRRCLATLSKTGGDFKNKNIAQKIHARRAERLVLGLDRLSTRLEGTPNQSLNAAVNRLFKLVQSVPDFEPEAFAKEMSTLPSL